MSLYQDIRGALQAHALLVDGLPPSNQIAFEGTLFTSTVGTPWAKMTLLPYSGRPFSVSGETIDHLGDFQIDYFAPAGSGSGDAESLADAIKEAFRPGARLVMNSTTVLVQYADRRPALSTADWYQVPVNVRWRAFVSAN